MIALSLCHEMHYYAYTVIVTIGYFCKMTAKQKAEVAKALYLITEKTQREICEIVDWSEKTFSEQKSKGKWGELREKKTMSKQQIVTELHAQTLGLLESAKDEGRLLKSAEIDGIAKLAAAIDKIESSATLETYIQVFEEYTKWMFGVDGKFAKANNVYQDMFINKLIAEG